MTKDTSNKLRPSKEERKRIEQKLFAGMAKTKLHPIDQQPLTAASSMPQIPTTENEQIEDVLHRQNRTPDKEDPNDR
jgi:hypothetical protein